MKPKRYLLFMGLVYYPQGGVKDLAANCDSIEECNGVWVKNLSKDHSKGLYPDINEYIEFQKEYTWAHIYDTESNRVVWNQ